MAATWFEKGRPALFQALSNVCDQIGRDLAAEVQTHNLAKGQIDGFRVVEDGRAEESDIVSRLEAENEQLRRQLAILRPPVSTSHSTTTSVASNLPDEARDSTHLSTNDSSGLGNTSTRTSTSCRDCSRVLRRYHALSANFKTAKEALQRRKEERNRWVQHSEYLKEKIQAAENQYCIQILDPRAQPMEVPTSTALEADEPILNPSLSFMSEGGPEEVEPQLPELASTPKPTGEVCEGRHADSETTQGEASDDFSHSQPLPVLAPPSDSETVVMKGEESSDIPEVISEREVRKRKRNEEPAETTVIPRIKSEMTGSSSPVMLVSPVQYHTQESIDLGDIVKKIQTPRKRQLLDPVGPKSEVIPRSKFTTLTPVHAADQQQPQSAIAPRQLSALMPLSVNARRIRPAPVKIQQKDRWIELNESIGSLAEDGAEYNIPPFAAQVKSPSVGSTKRRLDVLLNDPLARSEDENLISRLSRRPEPGTLAHYADLGIPGRRRLPFDKDGHVYSNSTPAKRPLGLKPVSEAETQGDSSTSPRRTVNRPSLASLRHRPLSKLFLEDFKVNPCANEGHDFAFTEVIRHKGDRACLPGCTDMHCCGKEFRAIAISQRPNPPLTAAQRQEEQKLLEDYLGDFSYRLASMDKDERTKVWIEAKTQELANKYGKHRHRFSRMQSPPGFWDADFPDTQQLAVDREEAARRTRRAVAERYREARRPGGRWIFKDE